MRFNRQTDRKALNHTMQHRRATAVPKHHLGIL